MATALPPLSRSSPSAQLRCSRSALADSGAACSPSAPYGKSATGAQMCSKPAAQPRLAHPSMNCSCCSQPGPACPSAAAQACRIQTPVPWPDTCVSKCVGCVSTTPQSHTSSKSKQKAERTPRKSVHINSGACMLAIDKSETQQRACSHARERVCACAFGAAPAGRPGVQRAACVASIKPRLPGMASTCRPMPVAFSAACHCKLRLTCAMHSTTAGERAAKSPGERHANENVGLPAVPFNSPSDYNAASSYAGHRSSTLNCLAAGLLCRAESVHNASDNYAQTLETFPT